MSVPGKQSLPKSAEDIIVHNIELVFSNQIQKDIIRNVLIQENWDLEKALRVLHSSVKSNNNKKRPKKKKKSNNPASEPSTPIQNFTPSCKPDLFKAAPNSKNKKEKTSILNDEWVFVNKPNSDQNTTKNRKIDSKTPGLTSHNHTKQDLLKAVQDENKSSPGSSSASRQARRALLLRNFDIIKHFGDSSKRISAYIKESIKVMVLLRGCSGSGKSTYASQLLLKAGCKNPQNHIFSTDNFFIGSNGTYVFNPDLLQNAHEWNQKLVNLVASEGRSPIFVDNTNSCLWEMSEYAAIAVQYGYIVETLEPPTPWFFNEDILFRKTSHSTPRETIKRMLQRYEANLTGEDVLKNLKLNYTPPMSPPLGAMAGIDSPLSKRHFKMLSIPLEISNITRTFKDNSFSTVEACDIVPRADQTKEYDHRISTSSKMDDGSIPQGSNDTTSQNYSSVSEITALSWEIPSKNRNCIDSYGPGTQQSLSESSSDIIGSDSDSTTSESSSEGCDSQNECDAHSPISSFENVIELEYVLVSYSKGVIFQKFHEEMKDVKTLEDFQKTVSYSSFSDILRKYVETSNCRGNDEICSGAKGDFCESDIKHSPEYPHFVHGDLNKAPLNLKENQIQDNVGSRKKENENVAVDINLPLQTSVIGKPIPLLPSEENKIKATEPEQKVANEPSGAIATLHSLFPKVSQDKLLELFGSSDVDLNWAVDLLLDSGQEMVESLGNWKLGDGERAKAHEVGNVNNGPPSNNSTTQAEVGNPVEPIEKKTGTSSSASGDISKHVESICRWDFKKETLHELPDDKPKVQRAAKSQLKNTCGIDIGTNTNYADFEIVRSLKGGCISKGVSVKMLVGNPIFISGQSLKPPDTSILMLDKGTMTSAIETNQVQQWSSGIERLALMFPQVSRENLEELFEKCQKDIDWAAGLLLDSGQEMSELFTSLEPIECVKNDDETSLNFTGLDLSPAKVNSVEQKPKRKKKIPVSESDNEVRKEIKENIQKNFILDERHYFSEKMKKYFQRKGVKDKSNISEHVGTETNLDEKSNDLNDDSSDKEEEIVFMVDRDLIFQLQSRFGGLLRPNMIGEKNVVNLPLSLARQLHSYVMDSIHEHIEEEDVCGDEDEEYARHLQEEELKSQGAPSLLEIMDEEVALRKTQKDVGSGRSMANILSKQLLIERFPKMDPSTLASILEDTNHSLHQATCVLSSAGHSQVEAEEQNSTGPAKSKSNEKLLSREEAIKQANAYGDIASQLYEMRKDCLRKSQKAYQEGNPSVALYYSEMARWHKERIEKSNSMAAKAILAGYEGWTTLDLHFLQVGEALNVLDLFVDEVIRDLQKSNKKRTEVFVITGRGLHSFGGRPILKPAVQSRLNKRDLRFLELNPGMLKVVIPRTALISYEKDTGS